MRSQAALTSFLSDAHDQSPNSVDGCSNPSGGVVVDVSPGGGVFIRMI